MGRNIVSQQKSTELESISATNETPDNYVAQIVKLIPAEIVGVYLGIQNLLSSLTEPVKSWMQLILFLQESKQYFPKDILPTLQGN